MKVISILLLIISLQHLLYAKDKNQYPPFIFKSQTLEGKEINLADYVGKKLIIVNFWATWCPPCRYEIPDLINLQDEFKEDIIIIGVSLDNQKKELEIFSQKNKFNYPLVHDTYGINRLYGGISAIPTTFIINYEGKIVERIVGARSLDSFRSYVTKYIKKKSKEKWYF